MDLNSSPAPEEDEEEVFNGHGEEGNVTEEHVESAVEVFRREREERRKKLKRAHQDDGPPRRDVNLYRNDGGLQARSHRPHDRDRLPPGWLDCPSYGQAIGYIIPSKVPLGEAFDDVVPPGKRYSFRQVMRVLGRDLGMVIDLTNTTRYYPASDWKKNGIKHVKIKCRGRGATPDNESVNNFVHEVSQFLTRHNRLKKCVLVHCTHGHNRTGFMIVHYLMRTQPIAVSEAIQMFANVRPPGIYKQDYIDELFTFYHERRPETVICPPTPEWKRSSDLDLNGEAVQDDDDDGNGVAPPEEVPIEQNVMTNDDVLGDAISADQQDELQLKCYQLLKLPPIRVKGGELLFPGSHPVSISRKNIQLLRQRYYYATWKADGTRYMMLIMHDGCYLIDRKFYFRRVQLRFPMKHSNEGMTHNLTLLDGEMVIDTLPGTKTQARRYLIYDLMVIGGLSITERPFYERWKLLEKEVIEPRLFERKNINTCRNPYYRYEMEPFSVRRKDFWLLSTVTKLLKEFIPMLSHAADGLIFQGWDDSYVTRTHEGLLKWKYPELNSVDFLFEVEDGREKLFVNDRGQKKLMDGSKILFKDAGDISMCSGKIIECSWDMEEGAWVFMRVRVDKSTPNEYKTYRKVFESIIDNITEEDLLKEIKEIVSLPMYADRIRNDSKPQIHHQQQGGRRK